MADISMEPFDAYITACADFLKGKIDDDTYIAARAAARAACAQTEETEK